MSENENFQRIIGEIGPRNRQAICISDAPFG